MKVIPASKARRRWSHVIGYVFHTAERVIIVRNHRPVAALVHPDDVLLLESLADEADIDEARRAIRRARGGKALTWSELRRFAQLDP